MALVDSSGFRVNEKSRGKYILCLIFGVYSFWNALVNIFNYYSLVYATSGEIDRDINIYKTVVVTKLPINYFMFFNLLKADADIS